MLLAVASSLRSKGPATRSFSALARWGWLVRCAPRHAARAPAQAAKLGFSVALVPQANAPNVPAKSLRLDHPRRRARGAGAGLSAQHLNPSC